MKRRRRTARSMPRGRKSSPTGRTRRTTRRGEPIPSSATSEPTRTNAVDCPRLHPKNRSMKSSGSSRPTAMTSSMDAEPLEPTHLESESNRYGNSSRTSTTRHRRETTSKSERPWPTEPLQGCIKGFSTLAEAWTNSTKSPMRSFPVVSTFQLPVPSPMRLEHLRLHSSFPPTPSDPRLLVTWRKTSLRKRTTVLPRPRSKPSRKPTTKNFKTPSRPRRWIDRTSTGTRDLARQVQGKGKGRPKAVLGPAFLSLPLPFRENPPLAMKLGAGSASEKTSVRVEGIALEPLREMRTRKTVSLFELRACVIPVRFTGIK